MASGSDWAVQWAHPTGSSDSEWIVSLATGLFQEYQLFQLCREGVTTLFAPAIPAGGVLFQLGALVEHRLSYPHRDIRRHVDDARDNSPRGLHLCNDVLVVLIHFCLQSLNLGV